MRLSGAVRKTLFAIGGVVLCELLARVVAPGINDRVLGDYLRSGAPGALLKFYDLLVGGALARGAVLALGIMPFVSAWILVRIGEMVVPMRDRVSRRWTRGLTFGLAVVQSYGFARFVEAIGAVDHPGTGFVARTMVLLTAGAMGVAWLGERFNASNDDERSSDEGPDRVNALPQTLPEELPLLNPGDVPRAGSARQAVPTTSKR